MKRQATNWEKIFVNHILDKELMSRIYEELFRLNNKTTTTTTNIFKNGQIILTNTLPRTYMYGK